MKVSCIIPTTKARLPFLRKAIRDFEAQTYPSKELVIATEDFDLSKELPTYASVLLLGKKRTIGEKRNLACDLAAGDLIAHFDDDDWSSPDRLTLQVTEMLAAGADVYGYRRCLFADDESREAFLFTSSHQYAVGTSLLYSRDYQQRNPFRPIQTTEDNEFVYAAIRHKVFACGDRIGTIVARDHSANTVDKREKRNLRSLCSPWTRYPYEALKGFGYASV